MVVWFVLATASRSIVNKNTLVLCNKYQNMGGRGKSRAITLLNLGHMKDIHPALSDSNTNL